jgi:hypothetical protein
VFRPLWIRIFMVLFGVLCLAVAPLMLFGDDPSPAAAAATVPFGVMCLAVGLVRPPRRGSTDGIARAFVDGTAATVFAHSRARRMVLALVGISFAIMGTVFLVVPGSVDSDTGWIRFLGVVTLLMGGLVTWGWLRSLRRPSFIALTPERVIHRGSGGFSVRWDAIEEVNEVEIRHTRMLGLQLTDPSELESAGVARLFRGLNRKLGAEASIPLNITVADPDLLAGLVAHMQATPQDRRLLADPGGADVLRRIAG